MCKKDKRCNRRKMSFKKKGRIISHMRAVGISEDMDISVGAFIKWVSPRRKKVLKKISNRKVRRRTDFMNNGSNYKKVYDLQWNLW